MTEEIRTLEYSQRLRDHSRVALADQDRSAGRLIFEGANRGAAQALGRGAGVITKSGWADILEVSMQHPDLADLKGDQLLDTWLFARDNRAIRNVWSAGRHMVQDGRHIAAAQITQAYRQTLARLRDKV